MRRTILLLLAPLLLSNPLVAQEALTPAQESQLRWTFWPGGWADDRFWLPGWYRRDNLSGRYILHGFGIVYEEFLPKPKGAK